MSPNPYPLFTISMHDTPEDIEKRIDLLVRLYLSRRDQHISKAIVNHINAILAYPRYIRDMETRCQLRRLASHWNCLGWINDKSTSQPSIGKMELKQTFCLQPNGDVS